MARTKVQSELIATNAISGTIIADGAITSTHLAANCVDSSELVTGSIDTIHIAANQVTATKIVTNAIQTRHIADDQVTADKLANSINTSIAAKLPLTGGALTGSTSITSSSTPLSLDRTGGATAVLELKVGGAVKGYLGASSSNILSVFNSSAAEKVTINSNGNATFAGTISSDVITVSNGSSTGTYGFRHEGAGKFMRMGMPNASYAYFETDSNAGFYLDGNTTVNGAITAATSLTVNSDANSSLTIKDGGTDAIQLVAGSGDELYIGPNNAYKLRFKTDGNIVMDNSGNFAIGTASPSTPLHVRYSSAPNS